MNDLRTLLEGAGLAHILIPRKEFVKEHTKLVKVLNKGSKKARAKEAKKQSIELSETIDGGSRASNFVARMMAESKKIHKGQYAKPTINDKSTMRAPVEFDLDKIANPDQKPSGTNTSKYGASPFLMYHFAHSTRPFHREGEERRPMYKAKRNLLKLQKESELQRLARKEKFSKVGEDEGEDEEDEEVDEGDEGDEGDEEVDEGDEGDEEEDEGGDEPETFEDFQALSDEELEERFKKEKEGKTALQIKALGQRVRQQMNKPKERSRHDALAFVLSKLPKVAIKARHEREKKAKERREAEEREMEAVSPGSRAFRPKGTAPIRVPDGMEDTQSNRNIVKRFARMPLWMISGWEAHGRGEILKNELRRLINKPLKRYARRGDPLNGPIVKTNTPPSFGKKEREIAIAVYVLRNGGSQEDAKKAVKLFQDEDILPVGFSEATRKPDPMSFRDEMYNRNITGIYDTFKVGREDEEVGELREE